ncbi:MAG: hypothetical protein IJ870_06680 [Alphaproteobacteria bacterium]|nr:hypothetical protein [Alphaproteobacteria bacterium]
MEAIIILTVLAVLMLILLVFRKPAVLIVGDEHWDGVLPKESPEFHEPCYVYADGKESAGLRFNIPIIGYRIAPNLIISPLVGYDMPICQALQYAIDHHGKVLSEEDRKVLMQNWGAYNALKKDVDDQFLLNGPFWVLKGERMEAFNPIRDVFSSKQSTANVLLTIER